MGCLHELLPSPPDAFGDGFENATSSRRIVREAQYVKEPESAGNDLAFSKRVLGIIAALLCNVFDARGGAIMVMVELMQRSEVSSLT